MSAGVRRARGVAQAAADWLVEELRPACERIEVAGGLRRKRPTVADVDLVLIPRVERVQRGQTSFVDPEAGLVTVNRAAEAVERLQERGALQVVKANVPGLVPRELDHRGRLWKLWLPHYELGVDVSVTDRDRWGAILTVRTGPADFSRALVQRWTQVSGGGHLAGGQFRLPGLLDRYHPTPEEPDVFEACRLAYVPPEDRMGETSVYLAARAWERDHQTVGASGSRGRRGEDQ